MPELSKQNRIEITVDRSLCIGSGDCVDTAPNVFQLDEEDKAVVVDPDGASVDEITRNTAFELVIPGGRDRPGRGQLPRQRDLRRG